MELTAENRLALVLPPYVAHGFQTLADDTEAKYQVSGPYKPRDEQGFRWDDPEFNIAWPLPITVISGKDASWPLIAEVSCLSRRDECPPAQHVALPGDYAVGVPNSHISCRPVALRRSAGSC